MSYYVVAIWKPCSVRVPTMTRSVVGRGLRTEKWKDLADKEALISEEGTAAKTAAR
jgi:hypothetical protein